MNDGKQSSRLHSVNSSSQVTIAVVGRLQTTDNRISLRFVQRTGRVRIQVTATTDSATRVLCAPLEWITTRTRRSSRDRTLASVHNSWPVSTTHFQQGARAAGPDGGS